MIYRLLFLRRPPPGRPMATASRRQLRCAALLVSVPRHDLAESPAMTFGVAWGFDCRVTPHLDAWASERARLSIRSADRPAQYPEYPQYQTPITQYERMEPIHTPSRGSSSPGGIG